MLNRRDVIASTVAVAAVAALGDCTRRPKAVPVVDGALGIASAANPHVFPLLLAMSLDPELPVRLIPISESVDADALFASGQADGLLAMTYMGARKRISGAIPDIRLHSIATWRGFFEVVPEGIASFADLRGKTVIVSGPIRSGKDGGGDVIFQAAARRQGIVPGRDLLVEYMPAQQGIAWVASGHRLRCLQCRRQAEMDRRSLDRRLDHLGRVGDSQSDDCRRGRGRTTIPHLS